MTDYQCKNGKFLENGHTIFDEDVLKKLQRLAFLEDQILKGGLVFVKKEVLKCGNPNPPCAMNIKYGMLECSECDWGE